MQPLFHRFFTVLFTGLALCVCVCVCVCVFPDSSNMATSGRKVVANPVAANPLEWDPGPPQYFDLRGQLRVVIFTNGGAFEPLPFRTILSFENLMFRTIFNDIVATSWRPFSVFVPATHEIAMLSIELLRTLKLSILSGPHRNVWPQPQHLEQCLRSLLYSLLFNPLGSSEILMFRTIFNDIVSTSWRPFSVFVPAAHEIAMLSIELLRTLKLLILSGPHRNVWPQPQPQHREQWWRPLLKPRSLETCPLFRLTVKSHAHSPLTRLLQSARCACSRRKGASSRRF